MSKIRGYSISMVTSLSCFRCSDIEYCFVVYEQGNDYNYDVGTFKTKAEAVDFIINYLESNILED